jgi:predicted DNA-binding antitoxin AbrB/MazE fold protein
MEFQAIYENGVFQPTGPVSLPERTPVIVVPAVPAEEVLGSNSPELYAILRRSYDTGEHDLAARVDELDP